MSWRRREAIRRGVDPKDVKDGPGNKDEWAMMRCCVPLDRVTIKGVQDYHSFATLVGLDVELDEQRNVWHPEKIAGGDFTSNDEVRSSRVKDLVKTVTGLDAPRRSFSFRNSIPFVKRSNSDQSPDRKLERSLSMGFPFHKAKAEPQMDSASTSASTPESVNSPSPVPIRRESTTWIDFTIPPVLAEGTSYATDWRDSFAFNVAVLNEQAWFVEALEAAVAAAAERKYRHDAARPKMSLDVAGYDCLATDEDIEGGVSRKNTASSGEDEESGVSKAMRKTEKASMAAKVFGLDDEGIWRE